MYINLDMTEGY